MKIKREVIGFPSQDGSNYIYGEIFYPPGEAKALIQFAHGMSDYGGRYSHFFEYLAEHGYAVAYNDHLGHGKTAATSDDLGYFAPKDGYKTVIEDFNKFYDILGAQFSNKPHFVIGHSMGSFIVRCFLASGKSQGAVIMGTGNKNPMADFGIVLSAILGKIQGKKHRSKFLDFITFMGYNRKITDSNHSQAWLSTVPQAQNDMLENDLRNKTFTTSGFQDLYSLVKHANSVQVLAATPKDLPIFFISGDDDPLGPYGKGVKNLAQTFKDKGFAHIKLEIIPGARHELCHENEEIQAKVFNYIVRWLNEETEKIEER